MEQLTDQRTIRTIGIVLIVFAIGFNLPYGWLAATFDYPNILRSPAGEILAAFGKGGASLIIAWAAFTLAALFFAPIAACVAVVTRRLGDSSSTIAGLGIAAAITQAIGLSRWVFAVPGLAASWTANTDPAARASVEVVFTTLHQFAGVGIGEALGQSLTAFWLVGVGLAQRHHPRFGRTVGGLGIAGGAVLLLGLAEGMATVISFDPGVLGLGALIGFLILTAWLIWTGVLCFLRPATNAPPV
jgi:hypothetical protein